METAPCCGPKPPSDQSADRDALGLLHRAASLTMVMCPRGPGANQVVGGGGRGELGWGGLSGLQMRKTQGVGRLQRGRNLGAGRQGSEAASWESQAACRRKRAAER